MPRASSCCNTWSRASCPRTRSRRWTATAWAGWCSMAAEQGRKTRPDLKVGICGEHGGDPASIDFCHEVGLNYVSAPPTACL